MNCVNGREAVQQLSVAQIDLVITDLSMPEMDGLELIKVLTFEWPEESHSDVGSFRQPGSTADREYAVDALLEKPFSLEEMLSVVQVSVGTESWKRTEGVKTPWFRN